MDFRGDFMVFFGGYWIMDLVYCLPNALVDGDIIPRQPLSTLIEVTSRMVEIPLVYNGYWVIRVKKPLRSM